MLATAPRRRDARRRGRGRETARGRARGRLAIPPIPVAGRAPMTAIYAALARVPSLMAQADGDS